ncbi:hypothetical protein KC338_g64 [Hortaea werneckii]|nr:hypothetical protein KC338_g64 [Hortaea werneckii]
MEQRQHGRDVKSSGRGIAAASSALSNSLEVYAYYERPHNFAGLHLGFLFSTNALTPSWMFSPAARRGYQVSFATLVASSAPIPSQPILIPSLLTMTASGLFSAIIFA